MTDYKNAIIYRNPKDNRAYASYYELGGNNISFKDIDAWPIYDFNIDAANKQQARMAREGKYSGDAFMSDEYRRNPFLTSDFEKLKDDYVSAVRQGGDVRMAAIRSSDNSAVNVVNVWTEVLGRRDRIYAGKNIAREIPVDKLLISIDTFNQFGGMVKIDEQGRNAMLKNMTYSRSTFTASKYGLKFVVTEESALKNVHDMVSDGVTVAGYKLDQRASFDTIAAANSGLTSLAATAAWDTYETGADRSSQNARVDLAKAALAIEGTGVGGKVTRIGMHPLTFAAAAAGNTHLKGLMAPSTAGDLSPGVKELPFDLGLGAGVGLVLDNTFAQGSVYMVDNQVEPCIAYFQGPQRMGTVRDEPTGDTTFYIVDYHHVAVIRAATGRLITSVNTLIAW